MNIEIGYEYPHSQWTIFHVFKEYHELLMVNNPDVNFNYLNFGSLQNRSAQNIYSPHVMTIKNIENEKYFIISYWDNVNDFDYELNGWNPEKCVNIFTSSGVHTNNNKVIPFSYLPYNIITEEFSKTCKNLEEKNNSELYFRGYLYGLRKNIQDLGVIRLDDNKIPITDYLMELDNTKISLSLNGAGEICNRDIEIISMKSVLLRPKLTQTFHNGLIDGVHYIGFEYNDDPKLQTDIILKKFNEIKDNENLLKNISENGYKWYLNNGTIKSNVNILEKIVDINLLK